MNKDVIKRMTISTGTEIIAPYFIKSKKLNLILFLLTKLENIIPAKAPIGVRNAPMLLPMIEA